MNLIFAQADTITRGTQIAIAGMSIVAVALILITLFIAALPKILEVVARVLPEKEEAHVAKSHPESFVADDEAVLAAIGFVLHNRRHGGSK